MNKLKDSDLTTFGSIIAVIIVTPIAVLGMVGVGLYFSFADGYVLAQLWSWFAVPQGLRPLAWPTFAAAMICLNVARNRYPKTEPKNEDKFSEKAGKFIGYALAPWAFLLVGWLIK